MSWGSLVLIGATLGTPDFNHNFYPPKQMSRDGSKNPNASVRRREGEKDLQ